MLDQGLNMGYYTAITISLLALLTLVIGSRITANKGYQMESDF
jgi:hypothetical protein